MNAVMRRVSVLVWGALLLSACALQVIEGSGNIVSESRPVSDFDGVTLAGSGELMITQGDTETLTVEADDNLLPHIVTNVQSGKLTLGLDRDDWTTMYRPSRPIRYIVTLQDLTSLELSGSGRIDVPSLKTDHLTLTLSGSGQIDLGQLEAGEFTYTHGGSGQTRVAGQVMRQELTLSGSGQYLAGDLKSEAAEVELPGSGSVTVWATGTLDVRIRGSGTVSYYDHPAINAENSGSGSVVSLGEK